MTDEKIFISIQTKFVSLKKVEQIAAIKFLRVFVGIFLFVSRVEVGEALCI
jgi:hypothetical protein